MNLLTASQLEDDPLPCVAAVMATLHDETDHGTVARKHLLDSSLRGIYDLGVDLPVFPQVCEVNKGFET